MVVGTSAGIAVILAALTGICLWKLNKDRKSVAWLALFAGLFGSYTVLGWIGTLATGSIFGVGILTLIIIVGGFIFWHEAVKGNGYHRYRSPFVGFAVGVALTASFGGVQHMVQHGTVQLTSVINQHATGR